MTKVQKIDSIKDIGSVQKAFQQNMEEKIHSITEKSGIDVNNNKKLVTYYQKCNEDAKELQDNIFILSIQKSAIIILIVFLIIIGISCVCYAISSFEEISFAGLEAVIHVILLVLAAILSFAGIFKLVLYIEDHIRPLQSEKILLQAKLDEKTSEAKDLCFKSIEPFLSKIDEFFTQELIQDTFDGFLLKKYLSSFSAEGMEEKAPGLFLHDKDISTIDILSGSLCNNPFVIRKIRKQYMINVPYTGRKEVTIEKWIKDSEGNKICTTEKQTLTAEITKPQPAYDTYYELLFVNDSAPDLSFTHRPRMLPSKIRSVLINKKHRSSVYRGDSNFTPMSNHVFENLFYAIDRDNDHQFRILFTPIAQNNIVELIQSKGDYFNLKKRKRLSKLQLVKQNLSWDLWRAPIAYNDYDYEETLKKIRNANNEYFQNFLMMFLPILSIPNYYDEPKTERRFMTTSQGNYSSVQVEALANSIKPTFLSWENTELMISAKANHSKNDIDYYTLDVHYFDEYPRIETVHDVPAKDGSKHDIDIEWTEYVPEKAEAYMMIKSVDKANTAAATFPDSKESILKQGLFGYVYLNANMDNEAKFKQLLKNIS